MVAPGEAWFWWADNTPGIVRQWVVTASYANINDTNFTFPNTLIRELVDSPGQIVLREVHVCWLATSSGAGNILQVLLYPREIAIPLELGQFTTTATYAHFDWQGELVVKWREQPASIPIVLVSILPLAAANDDVWFWMMGDYYEPTRETFGTPLPVSLEGYKWPLARR